MENFKFSLIVLACLVSAGAAGGYAQQNNVAIAGRALDERGEPVSNARVTLYYHPCRGCVDHILPVTVSLHDGVFFIDSTGVSMSGLRLFIEGPLPQGFWSPFGAPPFEKLAHLRQFRGIPIRAPKGTGNLDLGDVPVGIHYRKATVKLPKIFGTQYQAGPEAAKQIKLVVRDGQGKIVYSGHVPDIAFDPAFLSVNLAVPKGKWSLEFYLENRNRKAQSPRLSIDAFKSGMSKDSVLKLPKY